MIRAAIPRTSGGDAAGAPSASAAGNERAAAIVSAAVSGGAAVSVSAAVSGGAAVSVSAAVSGGAAVSVSAAVSGGITAAIALLALCACGFRLAGSEHLPKALSKPYLSVKDPYTDFARDFEHQLKSSGARLQPLRQDATATIEVTRDFVEQRTLAVSARNIPTDYELIYTVTFEVKGPDDQLLAPQTITLSRDYSFEENELLAKEHEADILREQMARDLVTMAMRRLTRLK